MEENKENAIKNANVIDIQNGGNGLADNLDDIDAVGKEEKSVDQIERMMSREEIFTVVRENGLYMNMLAPCVSANIFLDGRIMNFFTTPMKPIDLKEKVSDVMQIVLMEISKEKNGVVFKVDGSLDVGESIKQSTLNGIDTISILKNTIPEGILSNLEQRYFEMYTTGMEPVWEIISDNGFEKIDEEHLEKILSLGIKNSREELEIFNNHERYHDLFDGQEKTEDEKEEDRKKIESNQVEIDGASEKIIELSDKLNKFEKDSEEYNETLTELQSWGKYKGKLRRENIIMSDIDESKFEVIRAKGLLATSRIMKKIGLAPKDYIDITNEVRELNHSSSLARNAVIKEGVGNVVEKNYLTELSKNDIEKMSIYRERAMVGIISEQERNEYLVESLKNYITYSNIQLKNKGHVLDSKLVETAIEQALEGLITTIPSVKNTAGKLDWSRIVTAVQEIGYEDVTLENITKTFAIEKGKEIQNEINGLIKSAGLDFKEHEEKESSEFLDFFKEEEKALEIIKYVNYVRRLEEKGIANSATRIFKYKLEKEGMQNVLERADKMYEDSENYTEEIMDNYKRGYALKKYEEFKGLSNKDKIRLSREEKGSYISAMIAAYDISRDETSVSLEMQDAVKDVLGTFLGDVFDEQGDIDDNKLFKEYKSVFKNVSKYALGKESEDINAFWEFHEGITLGKVQNKVILHFMDAVNDRKRELVKDDFIKESEAKVLLEEYGEELDVSAITNVGSRSVSVDVPPITKAEVEEVVNRQGEQMTVDDPNENKVRFPKDKDLTKQGESSGLQFENIKVETALVEKKDKGLFMRALGFIREKVSNWFRGSSDSNNFNTTVVTSSGGIPQDNKTEQPKDISWVQPVELDIKAARESAEQSHGENKLRNEEEIGEH